MNGNWSATAPVWRCVKYRSQRERHSPARSLSCRASRAICRGTACGDFVSEGRCSATSKSNSGSFVRPSEKYRTCSGGRFCDRFEPSGDHPRVPRERAPTSVAAARVSEGATFATAAMDTRQGVASMGSRCCNGNHQCFKRHSYFRELLH
jgi:hypothetical protein